MEEWTKRGLAEELGGRQSEEFELHSFIDQRYEKGIQAGNQLARRQDDLQARQTAGYQKPKAGDLVLVRDFQQAKHKGAKLELQWSPSRILDRIWASRFFAHIRQLHDPPGITKRFHVDALLVYIPHSHDFSSRTIGVGELAGSAV